MGNYQKNPDEIGVLWEKKTKKGDTYFSGNIKIGEEEINIVCFQRDRTNDRQPAFNIMLSRPQEERTREEDRPQFGYRDTTQPVKKEIEAEEPPVEYGEKDVIF